MKNLALLCAVLTIAACSPAQQEPPTPSASELAQAPAAPAAPVSIEMPGEHLSVPMFKTLDSRIEMASSDQDTAHFLLQLKAGDIGGMGEIASSVRNISAAMNNGAHELDGLKTISFRVIDANNNDLGVFEFDRAALKKAPFKNLNHPAAMNLAKAIKLTPQGDAARTIFCTDRGQEAQHFCDLPNK
jgi:hypothetical protein